ncbi:GntR family transcriptional regulator [Caproicibacter fermentans]|uniref:GntR family transcriptional regulator n=1 Tax=Caproicibacter fermentans TaxID=2576756 RepID=A0A7G8TBP5_9FIRM|nr:GntR family transcriptional regulator [Caproicibacter fermentans]QNK41036.1 GntR family transcriptional regulator [Caproicibacter fermentans]
METMDHEKAVGSREEFQKRTKTMGDDIYTNLRSYIIELKIRPGEIVSIKDIAEEWGVGRSPVRDALIRLEKEGLITSLPQRGTMISRIDLHRVEEERFLRACLEEKTVSIFLQKHTDEDIENLKKCLNDLKESVLSHDCRKLLWYDDNFHKVFFTATNKELCWETLQNFSGHYRRVRLLTVLQRTILDNIIIQHEEILECIISKKEEQLQKLLQYHLEKINCEELELQERYPDLFEREQGIHRQPSDFLQTDFLRRLE